MRYVLSKLAGAVLAPGMLLLLALAASLLLLFTRRHWRAGRYLLAVSVVVLAVIAFSPLEPMSTAALENRFPANPVLPAKIDGIVVLGGAIDQYISQSRGQIALTEASERLFAAVMLAKAHPEAKVLFSGGSADPGRPEPKEAFYAARFLEDLGVGTDRLMIESQSRNTFENAVFSQRLAKPEGDRTWVLVTSARHMPRAVGVFRKARWSVVPWPVAFSSGGGFEWANADLPLTRLRGLSQDCHEWLGLVSYRLLGWSDSVFPAP